MKFASAIIVASLRVSSAMPCDSPANAALTRAADARMTNHPRRPLSILTPSASAITRMMSAWMTEISADRTSWDATSATRLTDPLSLQRSVPATRRCARKSNL